MKTLIARRIGAVLMGVFYVSLFFLLLDSMKAGDLNNGLVAYYPFNGNANDESGNRNHGTKYGVKLTEDRFGRENSAFNFAGSVNSKIVIKNSSLFDFTDKMSFSCWVKFNQPWNYHAESILWNYPYPKAEGFHFGVNQDDSFYGKNNYSFQYRLAVGGRINDRKKIDTFQFLEGWNHIAGVYGNGKMSLYVNGNLVDSNYLSGKISSTDHDLIIGGNANPVSGAYNRDIDDIRIYNRNLSCSEVKELYEETPGQNGDSYTCYGIDGEKSELIKIDLKTGKTTTIGKTGVGDGVKQWKGFDYNPADGKVYCWASDLNGGGAFYSVDLSTGRFTKVKSFTSFACTAMSFTPDGTLYAWWEKTAWAQGSLYKVDLQNGTKTLIGGNNGLPSVLGCALSPTGEWWAGDEQNNAIYKLSLTDARVVWSGKRLPAIWNNGIDIYGMDFSSDGELRVTANNYHSDMPYMAILTIDQTTGLEKNRVMLDRKNIFNITTVPQNAPEKNVDFYMVSFPESAGELSPGIGKQQVAKGELFTITAQAKPGYEFQNWNVYGQVDIVDPNSSETVVRVKEDNATITAIFVEVSNKKANLTINVNPVEGGTATPNGTQTVEIGDSLSISASPNEGYVFSGWTESGNCPIQADYSPETTVTVNGDSVLTANFRRIATMVNLTMEVNNPEGGDVTPAIGTSLVIQGSQVSITAKAMQAWKFSEWQIIGSAKIADKFSPETEITVDGHATAKAIFLNVQEAATLTILAEEGGEVDPEGDLSIVPGESIEINAKPFDGNMFSGWVVVGDAVIANPSSANTKVTCSGDAIVMATFADSGNSTTSMLTINLSTRKENMDRAYAKNLPMDISTFDPSQGATVTIDGKSFQINSSNGEFFPTGWGYMYKSFENTIRLYLYLDRAQWSFRCIKQDLSCIDNSNGIDAILSYNGQSYGGNYNCEEKNRWSFKSDRHSSENLDVSSNLLSGFGIQQAMGSFSNGKNTKQRINIQKAAIGLSAQNFNTENDAVIIAIDEVTLTIPAGSFDSKKDGVYSYKDKGTKVKVEFDLNDGDWKLSIPNAAALGSVTPQDGIAVYLTIGEYQGGIKLNPEMSTMLKYK